VVVLVELVYLGILHVAFLKRERNGKSGKQKLLKNEVMSLPPPTALPRPSQRTSTSTLHFRSLQPLTYTKTLYTLIAQQKIQDAIKLCTSVEEELRGNRAVLSILGWCYWQTQQWNEAARM
jgi:hypothetical protein